MAVGALGDIMMVELNNKTNGKFRKRISIKVDIKMTIKWPAKYMIIDL